MVEVSRFLEGYCRRKKKTPFMVVLYMRACVGVCNVFFMYLLTFWLFGAEFFIVIFLRWGLEAGLTFERSGCDILDGLNIAIAGDSL